MPVQWYTRVSKVSHKKQAHGFSGNSRGIHSVRTINTPTESISKTSLKFKKNMTSCKELLTKCQTEKKKKGYSLHSEVDWNVKETVRGILRRCTYFEVCYQIA